jgi:hypothetical protein
VYYSGHGETNGTHNFLVPYDFDLAKWRKDRTFDAEKVVLSKQFTQKLDAITAQKCLVILDCCHAESMPTDRGLSSSVLFLNALLTEETQGVAHNLALGSGRIILTSCEAHEKSLDLDTNGLFTKTLLECLNGSENIEKDGWVRLIDMMRYVPKTVKNTAFAQYNHAQNPMFKRIENLNSEDFIVCAYNIAQAKGLSGSQAPLQAPTQPIRNVLNFKTELYALLEAEQQNAITDIIIKINESPYTYDKVQMTTLKGANPMQLALMPAQYVSSTKLLINSLK